MKYKVQSEYNIQEKNIIFPVFSSQGYCWIKANKYVCKEGDLPGSGLENDVQCQHAGKFRQTNR